MSLSLRLKLQKILTLTFFISICGSAALGQALITYNHVVSIVEDKGGRFVLISTSKARAVLRPYVQYFPGENGQTIMVADFPYLASDKPPTVFTPPVTGVEQVRFAQLQASPPVFRIAITTTQPDILKKLEFHSHPGTLIMKWPVSYAPPQATSARQMTWKPYAPTASQFTPAIVTGQSPSLPQLSGAADVMPRQAPSSPQLSSASDVMPRQAPSLPQLSSASDVMPRTAPSLSRSSRAPEVVPRPAPSMSRSAPVPGMSGTAPRTAPSLSSASTGALVGATPCVARSESVRQVANAAAPTREGRHRVSPLQSDLATNSNVGSKKDASRQSPSLIAERNQTSTLQANKSTPSPTPATPSGITANNQIDNSISKVPPQVAPDFHLPSSGYISTQDSQVPVQGDVPPVKDKPFEPQGSFSQVAMLAASQVTGSSQAPPTAVQPTSAQSLLDKMKRSASFLESSSVNSVQKLLPQIAKDTNLIVGQNVLPEGKPAQAAPAIAVSGFCPLKVVISGSSTLSYSAFHLHEPERYVIDVQGLPPLTDADQPSLPGNGFVNGLRLSKGDQDSNRLVLDLTGCDIPIKEVVSDDQKSLSLIIGEGVNLFARLKAPTNAVVVLDAGHGGSDPGAERGDIREKEITLDVVEKLKNDLKSKGLKVILTRESDSFVSLEDRVKITNSIKPDCFVSVHVNSMETTAAIHGIETYYQTEQSKSLASVIHDSLVDNLNASDRNVRKARFYVVNHTPVPAILAEVGFISNKEERERLISSDYQDKVAEALADGVILYLDKRDGMVSLGTGKLAGAGGRALSNRSGMIFK